MNCNVYNDITKCWQAATISASKYDEVMLQNSEHDHFYSICTVCRTLISFDTTWVGYVSSASNTLMICCFMHFVASPACGIKNLSIAPTVSSVDTALLLLLLAGPISRLALLYENVINSGCRFLDVILSIVLRGRRA